MLSTSLSKDLYKRFVNPAATDRQVLTVARGAAVVGALAAVVIAHAARRASSTRWRSSTRWSASACSCRSSPACVGAARGALEPWPRSPAASSRCSAVQLCDTTAAVRRLHPGHVRPAPRRPRLSWSSGSPCRTTGCDGVTRKMDLFDLTGKTAVVIGAGVGDRRSGRARLCPAGGAGRRLDLNPDPRRGTSRRSTSAIRSARRPRRSPSSIASRASTSSSACRRSTCASRS